jgi:hypothetical protein
MMQEVQQHITKLRALAEAGQITWREMQTPRPTAMRAFEGQAEGYLINVAQANVEGAGVTHEGMVIATPMTIMRLPKDVADYLYHKAAAQRN